MRILLMGDASNYHHALSVALRGMGHEVVVASNGSRWMQTDRDIDISRPVGGKIGGALLWAKLLANRRRFAGFDVVQIVNPVFVELRPDRVARFFDFLRQNNSRVFLTALGDDTPYIQLCDDTAALAYNEWRNPDGSPTPLALSSRHIHDTWLADPLRSHCEKIYREIDGAATALYEYDLACRRVLSDDKVAYVGIPVDAKSVVPAHGDAVPERLRMFIGIQRGRMEEKGTDRLLAAARRVAELHPDKCELVVVENHPYAEYVELMRSSHVLLDQIYSYTPATNALLAMAAGLVAVSGGEEAYYDFIGERENHPIVNAVPDDDALVATLTRLVENRDAFPEMSRRSREFVLRHNDSTVVAERFINFWNR
ncbi:MAG: glycosyltransferase family 1 protein [Muribaculaceae bacterium]|nr:glycosyltransferase family 1 protein [Muribaculaceae bacterium]